MTGFLRRGEISVTRRESDRSTFSGFVASRTNLKITLPCVAAIRTVRAGTVRTGSTEWAVPPPPRSYGPRLPLADNAYKG